MSQSKAEGLDTACGAADRAVGYHTPDGTAFFSADEILDRLEEAGCARYVVTDVTRDGMLNGPNLDLLVSITQRTGKLPPKFGFGDIRMAPYLVGLLVLAGMRLDQGLGTRFAAASFAEQSWEHILMTAVLSPLARLIRWLRGGPYADVVFA